MTATIPVVFPANRLVANDFHSQPFIVLTNSVGGIVGTCGSTDNEINQDRGTITVAGSVNCASPPAPSKVTINNCAPVPGFPFNPGNCHKFESIVIDFGAAAGCTQPQPGGCSNDGGGVGGACCVGPFGSAPVVGGGIAEGSFPVDYTRSPSASTAFGEAPRSPIALTLPESAPPGFELRYLYGGPSSPGAPENPNWIRHLGQHWTNEYSQRIVPSPDETSVWLITSSGAFRNFSTPDVEGTYQDRFPLSEKRALHWLGAGQGWQLDGLDGSATFFRADGLWERSADAHGVEAVGTYGSNPPRLTKVDLPDGRHVEINYFANGKVSSMIEVGVSGSSTRTWSYVWTAVDTSSRIDQNLRRVVRPDGARWRLTYDGELIPHLIRAYLEGTGGTPSRVAGAWEFDASGNLAATWRGAESFAASTDPSKYSWIYSDESTVQLTDGYGSTTTFTYEREPLSGMPRVLAVAGACPGCVGLAPNSAMAYEDLENPLKPTEITNGRGFVTRLAYDEQGMLVSRREAELEAGFDRTTAWQYSGPFDALATRIEGPAGQGEVASRIVDLLYEADGDLESRTTSGEETDGIQVPGTFQYTTNFTHTAQGVRESSDPPGYGIDDVTSWTITDVSRGLLLPAKRTDPLVGDTLFSWDDFNRKSTETDANGLVTERQYDSMSRIAEVKLHGDLGTTADDLVTRYFYTPLGEIGCVKYPRGNGVQYLYESTTGRLAETIRGTAVTNPTSSTCLDSAQPRERRLLTYTLAGGTPPFVVNEQLQRFVGGVWVTDAENERVYETSCQLSKSIAGANHPEASTTSFGYDCNGNTTSVTQALGTALETTTTYAFDPLDRLQSVTQAWGGTGGGVQMTAYEYDA